MQKPIEITVGGAGPYDPAAGQADCLIPTLRGQDLVISHRTADQASGGFLKTGEFTLLSAGGFRLGVNFVAGDLYFVFEGGVVYASGSTNWTNGFNYSQVVNALFGRIGWRQETIDGAPVANGANATSRSGRYFQDFHAVASLNVVKKILDDAGASDLEINAWLDSFQRSVILQALNGVLNEPERLELGLDFVRYGEQIDRAIISGNSFVGRRITPAALADVAIQLDSVSLYFDTDITFPLYLYQEGRKAPLWTDNVTAIAHEKTVVNLPDLVLGFLSANHFGGAYYFGYYQSDLGAVKAIDESRMVSPCACLWRVEFIESDKVGGDAFNRQVIKGSPWSHGLNIQLTAFRDWTAGITKNPGLFDELLGLQMAAQILERALFSIRSNPTERILKDQLLTLGISDLTGTTPGVPEAAVTIGLREMIRREVLRVKKSFYPRPRGINYPTE